MRVEDVIETPISETLESELDPFSLSANILSLFERNPCPPKNLSSSSLKIKLLCCKFPYLTIGVIENTSELAQ